MHRYHSVITGLGLALFAVAIPLSAEAQQRRSATPNDGPPPPVVGTPRNPRFPFAGAWSGSRRVGPEESAHPIGMALQVADSAKPRYNGALIMPDGGRIPIRNATLTGEALTWESPNSGGGKWIYAAKVVSRDSIAGTLVLRGAPWNPVPEPSGTFALVRRAPGAQ